MGSQPTRIAYVTGGMGGIGTAICRRLCREGHTVIAGCGPGSARKDRWLSEMRAEGCNIHASEGNVSDWDSTKRALDRKSTRLNSSHSQISYAVFCLKKKRHRH